MPSLTELRNKTCQWFQKQSHTRPFLRQLCKCYIDPDLIPDNGGGNVPPPVGNTLVAHFVADEQYIDDVNNIGTWTSKVGSLGLVYNTGARMTLVNGAVGNHTDEVDYRMTPEPLVEGDIMTLFMRTRHRGAFPGAGSFWEMYRSGTLRPKTSPDGTISNQLGSFVRKNDSIDNNYPVDTNTHVVEWRTAPLLASACQEFPNELLLDMEEVLVFDGELSREDATTIYDYLTG